jgi:hypothetical protein
MMDFDHIPAGDGIAGSEMLVGQTRHRADVHGVDLDKIARDCNGVVAGLADGERPGNIAFSMSWARAEGFTESTSLPEVTQDAAHGGSRGAVVLLSQEHGEAFLAPPREGFAQLLDPRDQRGTPATIATPLGAPATILQALQTLLADAFGPAVERGPRALERPTGLRAVQSVATKSLPSRKASQAILTFGRQEGHTVLGEIEVGPW